MAAIQRLRVKAKDAGHLNPSPEQNQFWHDWLAEHPDKVDEVAATKNPILLEDITDTLDPILEERVPAEILRNLPKEELIQKILKAHEKQL